VITKSNKIIKIIRNKNIISLYEDFKKRGFIKWIIKNNLLYNFEIFIGKLKLHRYNYMALSGREYLLKHARRELINLINHKDKYWASRIKKHNTCLVVGCEKCEECGDCEKYLYKLSNFYMDLSCLRYAYKNKNDNYYMLKFILKNISDTKINDMISLSSFDIYTLDIQIFKILFDSKKVDLFEFFDKWSIDIYKYDRVDIYELLIKYKDISKYIDFYPELENTNHYRSEKIIKFLIHNSKKIESFYIIENEDSFYKKLYDYYCRRYL
jgi:hypothetical protein